MNDNKDLLNQWRQEIDRIDDAIHDLIMQRGDIVKNIAKAKDSKTRLPIRVQREAQMLKRLYANHDGALPFISVVYLWYDLISAYTQAQQKYSMGVLMMSDDAQEIWDLARRQFGGITPCHAYDNIDAMLHDYEKGKIDIVIIPSHARLLIAQCVQGSNLSIFSRVASVCQQELSAPKAFALANLPYEEYDDMQWVYLDSDRLICSNQQDNGKLLLGTYPKPLVIAAR